MSGNKTKYHEAQTLDRIFDNQEPDGALDGVYVALWETAPDNQPDPSNEVTGGEYESVAVPAEEWELENSNDPRRYINKEIVDFGKLDLDDSTTVAGAVLMDGDDASVANLLYHDTLEDGEVTIEAGNKFEIEDGKLTVEEN